jgi:hypothetical protein
MSGRFRIADFGLQIEAQAETAVPDGDTVNLKSEILNLKFLVVAQPG